MLLPRRLGFVESSHSDLTISHGCTTIHQYQYLGTNMHALSRNVVNSRRSSQAVSENASSTDYCYSDLTESNEKEGPSTPTAAFPIAIQPLDRDKAVPSSPTPAFPIAIQPSYGFRNMGGILRSLTNRSASKQGPTEGRVSSPLHTRLLTSNAYNLPSSFPSPQNCPYLNRPLDLQHQNHQPPKSQP